ncbi:MAG TPA: tripartite tricarboxylate transporter substrate binding protein [Reyranella sp.]|jgi:tripartite-type tricarboxylate transporter receptor subunit TctC
MLRRSLLASGVALPLIGTARAQQTAQQTWPTKPIRLVVGYSPGGGNDLIARIVSAKLQDKLGQPVVVDNKPGAQSIVAAEIVAKAPPDGYTLLVAPSGPMTINPAVYSKLPYDPLRDFAPVSLLAEFPLVMVVGADQPVKSVKELVEFGKANPKLANYASSATPFQLASELFNQRTGSSFQHIPYKGSGEMVQAVLSGQVLMTIADSAPVAGPLKSDKLRAIGITTAKRPPAFPDVPTFTEQGISDMEISLWTGVVAPNGTPTEVVERLQDLIEDTIELPAVRAALEAINVDARSTSPKEFHDLIVRDAERWKTVATKANIKLD